MIKMIDAEKNFEFFESGIQLGKIIEAIYEEKNNGHWGLINLMERRKYIKETYDQNYPMKRSPAFWDLPSLLKYPAGLYLV